MYINSYCNLAKAVNNKYNHPIFGTRSNESKYILNKKEEEKLYNETERVLSSEEAYTAIKKGYKGITLMEYANALNEGLSDTEAQIYADNNLGDFYLLYEEEFQNITNNKLNENNLSYNNKYNYRLNPYTQFKPSSILSFMKENGLNAEEAVYAIGFSMDEKTIKQYKNYLNRLKSQNNSKETKIDKFFIKLSAECAINVVKRQKKSENNIIQYLVTHQDIPQEIAKIIAENNELLEKTEVLKSLFTKNRYSDEYRIYPDIPLNDQEIAEILTNPIIIKNFDRYIGLISTDKETKSPVCEEKRALTAIEAYYVIKHKLPDRELNNFIFYCNCGIAPDIAVNMLLKDNK